MIRLTVAGVTKLIGRDERSVRRWFEGLTPAEKLRGRGSAPAFLIDDELIGLRTSAENRELLKKKLKSLAVAAASDLKDASAGATPARSKAGATARDSKSMIELADWAKETADARREVLSCLEGFAAARNVKSPISKPLLRAFIEAIERGEIPLTAAVREKIPTHSVPTLRRWWNDFHQGGLVALAPRFGNRLGDGIIDRDPVIKDHVIGMMGRWPTHVRPYRILKSLRAEFPDARLPSRTALRDWINRWVAANRAVFAATANPRVFKNAFRVSFGQADAEVAGVPNALWEIDTTVGDMFLLDDDGRLRRFCILGVIDVGIKRVKFFVIRSESSADVRRALCQLILEWGVPLRLRGDNGAGYVAEQTQRFCRDLGIQYEPCDPFSPWQKPHIERAFRTLQHDYFEILPSFCGHDVRGAQALREQESFAARFGRSKEIAAKHALRPEELQRGIDAWCIAYAERNGAARRLSEWTGEIRLISDQRALELLVEDGESRTLNKTGVFYRGARFIAVEFADHIGERALVFADPRGDLGRLYVFIEQRQGRKFLCVAESVERLGVNRNDTAILAKLAQARFIGASKADIRRAKRTITPELVADAMTKVEAGSSSSPSMEGIADEVAHQTRELSAAADALREHSIQSSITSEDVREADAQAGRYRELRARPERELSAADRRWIAWFQTSPVFKAYSMADEAAAVA